jgi:catalase
VLSMLANVSAKLAKGVAEGLGMKVPAPMPRAIARAPKAEVTVSPTLSLMARPGQTGIRTRMVAMLVADGVDEVSLFAVRDALLAQGAVPRLVGPRIGPFRAAGGAVVEAEASMENEPAVLFDALVLPDGAKGVAALSRDGHTAEYIKEQYRHCKPILVLDAASTLLDAAGASSQLADGSQDPGIVLAREGKAKPAIERFVAAIARHRVFERDRDPPPV